MFHTFIANLLFHDMKINNDSSKQDDKQTSKQIFFLNICRKLMQGKYI